MIEIIGTEGSSEWRAALMVRDALEATWPGVSITRSEQDDIKIAVSVKISGYKVQDIDIVLVCQLSGPRLIRPARVIRGHAGNHLNDRALVVESFVVAIEVKDQDDKGVRINDDQVQVRYSRAGRIEWKSATDQNVDQVHSLKAAEKPFEPTARQQAAGSTSKANRAPASFPQEHRENCQGHQRGRAAEQIDLRDITSAFNSVALPRTASRAVGAAIPVPRCGGRRLRP